MARAATFFGWVLLFLGKLLFTRAAIGGAVIFRGKLLFFRKGCFRRERGSRAAGLCGKKRRGRPVRAKFKAAARRGSAERKGAEAPCGQRQKQPRGGALRKKRRGRPTRAKVEAAARRGFGAGGRKKRPARRPIFLPFPKPKRRVKGYICRYLQRRWAARPPRWRARGAPSARCREWERRTVCRIRRRRR